MQTLLAIESSCDETAAAVVRDGPVVLADVVSTQVARHAPFGGVVPEIASREHMATVTVVVSRALADAKLEWRALDAVAVTVGPGLIGSLFVGTMFAKGLCLALGLPLLEVNHLEAHLAASDLLTERPSTPHVALLVSGGHTALYRVDGPFAVSQLGTTLDDAAGEAFDKTAKMLGLGYPGGAELSRAAFGGQRDAVPLPVGLSHLKGSLDFSFSGLKTAVSLHLKKQAKPIGPESFRDICASIEGSIVTALVNRTRQACEREGVNDVVLGGGVAANEHLRESMAAALAARGGRLFVPPKIWCTDNAAMVGAAGLRRLQAGRTGSLAAVPRAYWPLGV